MKTEVGYTPGPWILTFEDGDALVYGGEPGSEDVHMVADMGMDNPHIALTEKQQRYNALLISAAPELLELLVIANSKRSGSHTKAWKEKARKAIFKATHNQKLSYYPFR